MAFSLSFSALSLGVDFNLCGSYNLIIKEERRQAQWEISAVSSRKRK